MPKKKDLWDFIFDTQDIKKTNIKNFKKASNLNSKISLYNYKTHGLFFLKNIIFHMASSLGEHGLAILQKIPNRYVDEELQILFNNEHIDLDYLQAVEEILFLQDDLKKFRYIVEIGAGYGRTCHSILSLFPNIEKFTIVDLPDMLKLSRKYLKSVCTKQDYEKIEFIPSSSSSLWEGKADLVINIDSMQEMNKKTIRKYLNFIDIHANHFFCKNTIGKFDPSVGGFKKSTECKLAIQSGLLTDVINIFSLPDLASAQNKFLSTFSPGTSWVVQKHSSCNPWSHYYQALYKKDPEKE